MQIQDAVVVVTGAGSGIGAALATRLAGCGARVAVNDVDARAAGDLATKIGGMAFVADVASENGTSELIEFVRRELGEIDLSCANAGVMVEGGPELSDDRWELAWQLHVMAHVRAVRELLPRWLARGRGHFLATASAAGLLSVLGAAPYAVSKHATVAFAEWLAATYAHRGVTVQCLCPQGVRTSMYENSSLIGRSVIPGQVLEPATVAQVAVDALGDGRFLILPHPEVAEYAANRAADPERWLGRLRHEQRRLEDDHAFHGLDTADNRR